MAGVLSKSCKLPGLTVKCWLTLGIPSGQLEEGAPWQSRTDFSLWNRPGPLFVFIDKVLWEHKQGHLFTCCLWLLSSYRKN